MHQILARNVNEAYVIASQLITSHGELENTRNGPALVVSEPVTTHYQVPEERVLFNAKRDANPFFHFFESLWILSGRNDVKWLSKFSSNISKYSDDGQRFYGAYGYRLRHSPRGDMLMNAVNMLIADPWSRRVYLPIYQPTDLGVVSKDIPCNLGIKFELKRSKRDEEITRINMVVFNRSNDILWGCYGANVVHFSFIQEWMAMHLGVEMGWYEQISANWHCYENLYNKHDLVRIQTDGYYDPYRAGEVEHRPLLQKSEKPEDWDADHVTFMKEAQRIPPVAEYRTSFFRDTASPMLDCWEYYKEGKKELALSAADNILASDWRVACNLWLKRRKWNSQNLPE